MARRAALELKGEGGRALSMALETLCARFDSAAPAEFTDLGQPVTFRVPAVLHLVSFEYRAPHQPQGNWPVE